MGIAVAAQSHACVCARAKHQLPRSAWQFCKGQHMSAVRLADLAPAQRTHLERCWCRQCPFRQCRIYKHALVLEPAELIHAGPSAGLRVRSWFSLACGWTEFLTRAVQGLARHLG
jgi:hypothetical protein